MKYLIVNGDAFGASQGINRGILEAHRDGIPTSASLSVDRPGSAEAAELAHAPPSLGIGLHVDLDGHRRSEVREQLLRQLKRFVELLGSSTPGTSMRTSCPDTPRSANSKSARSAIPSCEIRSETPESVLSASETCQAC